MSVLKAAFLGLVQGITEFLPISSSGHLAIFQQLFHFESGGMAFEVFLHVGTLIAVCVVYWKDIVRLIADAIGILVDAVYNAYTFFRCRISKEKAHYRKIVRSSYRKFAMLVIVSTIPTAILGALGSSIVDAASGTLIVPGICLIITAALLLISDNVADGQKTPRQTSYLSGLFIGICQGIATLPGLSRSGTTITAGLLCGLRRDFVVKYSFIMSIPAIVGAAIFEIPDMKYDIAGNSAWCYVVGVVVSAIVGYICIRAMLVLVKNKKFKYFSIYCLIVGIICIVGYFVTR